MGSRLSRPRRTPAAGARSLRHHWTLTLVGVVGALIGVTVVSASSVAWASWAIDNLNSEITPLQLVNGDVMQDMTDAETGLRGYGISGSTSSLQPYELAMNWLPQDQQELQRLAAGYPALERAVERQRQVIAQWLREYAERRIRMGEQPDTADDRLFVEGDALFTQIREANSVVDQEIEQVAASLKRQAHLILWATLAAVAGMPFLAAVAVTVLARRFSRTMIEPLTGIAAVLARLRAGEVRARAEVTGPLEVREIAAGLNLLTEENMRASEVEGEVLSQLESIDRVRTDLVSTVSHELRTPLTSINGYLELLQDDLQGRLTDDEQTMLAIVRRNLDRLNELITNLLALSRAEETQLAVEPVDLRGIASEVAADIRLTAASRDIMVRTLLSPSPVVVVGDRSQLIRAVQNLATNAVKFSRQGGTVELRVLEEGAEAVVEVLDEGIGIPAADLAGLGSRFYRASNAMRAEIAGTGLGLRIVQTILGRHEGTLAVDSVEGEGSTFTVRLPLCAGMRAEHRPEIQPVAEPAVETAVETVGRARD